ncbi:hypothetical protein AGLY_015220 [Aphis glycines]|uniref:Uncharacterized protein n=1 Tax=Aphis glycines TaxID=307491 RepID=A0A6G0T175_APHGL|nr:hypothetical protein AGLY_015220 [Aphis glycines]
MSANLEANVKVARKLSDYSDEPVDKKLNMSTDEVESEIHFMKTYGILKWDELIKLNDDRKSLNQKITLGLATREELSKQIKVELNMLDMCQLKIDQEMKENDTEYINTEILTILSNRINELYNHMFLLFPVEKTSLSEYIEFCSNNVSENITILMVLKFNFQDGICFLLPIKSIEKSLKHTLTPSTNSKNGIENKFRNFSLALKSKNLE